VDDQAPGPAQSTAAPEPVRPAVAVPDDCCEVCLVTPRGEFALVPCSLARFCETCGKRVAEQQAGCPCGYFDDDARFLLRLL